MVLITVSKSQQVWSIVCIASTFTLGILFSQVLKFKPNWAYGSGYIVFGTLASVFLYMTFFNDRTFVSA
jgi:hypothetical protein